MKLKEFNPENTIAVRGVVRVAAVSINTTTGLFNFNRAACDLLEVKDGSGVLLHQDEEEPENWYIEKAATGFVLREKGNVTKGLLFNNTTIAREIQKAFGFKENSCRFLISGKSTAIGKRKLFGLLSVPKA